MVPLSLLALLISTLAILHLNSLNFETNQKLFFKLKIYWFALGEAFPVVHFKEGHKERERSDRHGA